MKHGTVKAAARKQDPEHHRKSQVKAASMKEGKFSPGKPSLKTSPKKVPTDQPSGKAKKGAKGKEFYK